MTTPLKVLVVEDSWLTVEKLTSMLDELGHSVVANCKNGLESLEHYKKYSPDLVTMDITMPEVNGIEATKRIMSEDAKAKVIIVTSHGQEQMVMDAIDAGAVGYVLKPFRSDKLKETIESVFYES